MSVNKVTHAQRWALRQIARGEIRSTADMDLRVIRGLRARGLLAVDSGRYFGRIDRTATLAKVKAAGVAL